MGSAKIRRDSQDWHAEGSASRRGTYGSHHCTPEEPGKKKSLRKEGREKPFRLPTEVRPVEGFLTWAQVGGQITQKKGTKKAPGTLPIGTWEEQEDLREKQKAVGTTISIV